MPRADHRPGRRDRGWCGALPFATIDGMHLDGRTLFIVATLATGLLSIFGVVLWSNGRSYPGCRRWIVGHLMLAASLLLLSLRAQAEMQLGLMPRGIERALERSV